MTQTYTGDQINYILKILNKFNFIYNENEYKKIDEKIIKYASEEYEEGLMDSLLGYKFKYYKEGDHFHDGQIVDYYLTFKSPSGKKTTFLTEMCLMVGWNHWENVIIK